MLSEHVDSYLTSRFLTVLPSTHFVLPKEASIISKNHNFDPAYRSRFHVYLQLAVQEMIPQEQGIYFERSLS